MRVFPKTRSIVVLLREPFGLPAPGLAPPLAMRSFYLIEKESKGNQTERGNHSLGNDAAHRQREIEISWPILTPPRKHPQKAALTPLHGPELEARFGSIVGLQSGALLGSGGCTPKSLQH